MDEIKKEEGPINFLGVEDIALEGIVSDVLSLGKIGTSVMPALFGKEETEQERD